MKKTKLIAAGFVLAGALIFLIGKDISDKRVAEDNNDVSINEVYNRDNEQKLFGMIVVDPSKPEDYYGDYSGTCEYEQAIEAYGCITKTGEVVFVKDGKLIEEYENKTEFYKLIEASELFTSE